VWTVSASVRWLSGGPIEQPDDVEIGDLTIRPSRQG
jgi:hypothetical protein